MKDGDIVNLDVSCYYNGFHGDLNETYCVGKVDEAGKRLIKNARECLEKAIAMGKNFFKKNPKIYAKDLISLVCCSETWY